MNFSHGSYDYHRELPVVLPLCGLCADNQLSESVIDNVREAERVQPGRQVAIALDTKGPEIRTGNTAGDIDIPIAAGTEINITTDEKYAAACDDKNMLVSPEICHNMFQLTGILQVRRLQEHHQGH